MPISMALAFVRTLCGSGNERIVHSVRSRERHGCFLCMVESTQATGATSGVVTSGSASEPTGMLRVWKKEGGVVASVAHQC